MGDGVRILIAYDGSDDAAAAIAAAARLLPGVTAIVVYVRAQPLTVGEATLARAALPETVIADAVERHERAVAEAAQATAERGAATAQAAGLPATAVVRTAGAPWHGLCAAAEEHEADLIACGSRGQGGISRAVLGSTSTSLLHHAPVPVLVLPRAGDRPEGPLLIGYDGSDGAREAIAV